MKIYFFYILSFLIFITFSAKGASCSSLGDRVLNYSASVDSGRTYAYRSNDVFSDSEDLGIRINSCKDAGRNRKSLMIGFAPVRYGLDSEQISVEYTDDLGEEKCKIKNSPFRLQSKDTKNLNYLKKKRFLDLCVERKVKHFGRYQLKAKIHQEKCKIKKLNKREAILKGSVCFFNIFPDSEFYFTQKIKKECTNPSFLAKHDLNPMEVSVFTTVNIVGNQTGNTDDFELVDSRLVNFQVEASKNDLRLSDDWGLGLPQFPEVYKITSLELAKPSIKNLGEGSIQFELPFIVDRKCERICDKSKICRPNLCDYSLPISSEIELFQIENNGRKSYLNSWFAGGVIPPNWQGFVKGGSKNITNFNFEANTQYMIEVTFKDPKIDFLMFNRSLSPLIELLPGMPTAKFSKKIALGLPVVNPLVGFPVLGSFRDIGDILNPETSFEFDGELPAFSKHTYWPPYYSAICSNKNNCIEAGSKSFATYRILFTAKGFDENNELIIGNIRYARKSAILGNFERKNPTFSKISCPWDE